MSDNKLNEESDQLKGKVRDQNIFKSNPYLDWTVSQHLEALHSKTELTRQKLLTLYKENKNIKNLIMDAEADLLDILTHIETLNI